MPPRDPFYGILPDVLTAREEKHLQDGYFWDNSIRKDQGSVVIQLTLSGSAFFEDVSGKSSVKPGQVMLFCFEENSSYGIYPGDPDPYHHIWVEVSGALLIQAQLEQLRGRFGSVLNCSLKGEAGHLMRQLVDEEKHQQSRDRLLRAEAVYRLFLSLLREQLSGQKGRDPVAFGRYLMESQFRSPRSLQDWAEEVGLSREHFSREFSKRYAESPAAFLRRLRLQHAHTLLHTHSMHLADVAAASGFASAQTFHRAYRKAYGVPPGRNRGA